MMNKCIIISLPVIVLLVACSNEFNAGSVSGVYIGDHNKGVDRVTIRKDGTYTHYYKRHDGKIFEYSSTWVFEKHAGKPGITFNNFIFGIPGYGTKEKGFWNVEIEKSFLGKIKLCIDPDLHYYYVRQT